MLRFAAVGGSARRKVKTIRAEDVTDVRKLPGLLPANAIVIKIVHEDEIVFANFLSRDRAYDMLTRILWRGLQPAAQPASASRPSLFVATSAAPKLRQRRDADEPARSAADGGWAGKKVTLIARLTWRTERC